VIAGRIYGLAGALSAFPRRLAAKAIKRQGGEFQHRATRRTTHVVFGRALLDRSSESDIEARRLREIDSGRVVISENGLLRALALLPALEGAAMARQQLIDQSKLAPDAFDLLSLFDCFESHAEPYSFRDLILARKYAGLIAGGASWGAIARSVHRSGPVASLTALSLHAADKASIYARLGEAMTELDGQGLLPFGRDEDADLEELFASAENAERDGKTLEAAALYGRCLALDPTDAVAAFNQAHCLQMADRKDDAVNTYLRTLKIDPKFVEAWFNLADLQRQGGDADAARRHLARAIRIDPGFADAIYNLASLEFDSGDFAEARQWWQRYLEFDTTSEWAKRARQGIRYVELELRQQTAG